MGAKKAKKRNRTKLGKSKVMGVQETMESFIGDPLSMYKNLESLVMAKITFTPEYMTTLDELLSDTYARQCPKPTDYQKRLNLVQIFNIIAQDIYGNSNKSPVIEGYGSFVMDLFNEKSDLDMSINFVSGATVGRGKKISTLRKFIKTLYAIQRIGHITSVSLIETARVPIIKFTDRGTGIECDLSVENRDGIAKSHIIHAISAIDERFRRLCFLMKSWAQAHNINSSKDRTLNSLSIVSLVAFHLQTCSPPIFPPFSVLLQDGANPASVIKVVKEYLNYGKDNNDSLAKLFITLFVKLASAEQLWKNGFCVSLFQGSWISKPWRTSYLIRIEDFTDPSQNVARAVGAAEFGTIYNCIHASLRYLMDYLNGKMQNKDLFGQFFVQHSILPQELGGRSNANHVMNNQFALLDSLPSKKRRLEEQGLAQSQAKKQARQGAKPQGTGGMQHVGTTTVVKNAPASFTPLASHRPPLVNPGVTKRVQHHQSYGPRIAPPGLIHPNNPSRLPRHFHTQTPQSFVQYSPQDVNAVDPTGFRANRPYMPPASHNPSHPVPPHMPPLSHNPSHHVPPIGLGANRLHMPPASHNPSHPVPPARFESNHPHMCPPSHNPSHPVPLTGFGSNRPHMSPASHNPSHPVPPTGFGANGPHMPPPTGFGANRPHMPPASHDPSHPVPPHMPPPSHNPSYPVPPHMPSASHNPSHPVPPIGLGANRQHMPPASHNPSHPAPPIGMGANRPQMPLASHNPSHPVPPTRFGANRPQMSLASHNPSHPVPPTQIRANHPHMPPASHSPSYPVPPTGFGASRPHMSPASHNPSHLAPPTRIGANHPHMPPASHNPSHPVPPTGFGDLPPTSHNPSHPVPPTGFGASRPYMSPASHNPSHLAPPTRIGVNHPHMPPASHNPSHHVPPTGFGDLPPTSHNPSHPVPPTGFGDLPPASHNPPHPVAPDGFGAIRSHLPPASHNPSHHVAPAGFGAIRSHLPLASHNPSHPVASNVFGAIRPHLPPASHNPYGGFYTLHDERRY